MATVKHALKVTSNDEGVHVSGTGCYDLGRTVFIPAVVVAELARAYAVQSDIQKTIGQPCHQVLNNLMDLVPSLYGELARALPAA